MTEQPTPSAPSPPLGDGPPAPPPPLDESWTTRKFILVVSFVLAFHVALIFLLGTKKQILPRPTGAIPHLQLADNTDEFIALSDPTLFARPNAHDLVTTFWRHLPPAPQPDFDVPEAPLYLPPDSLASSPSHAATLDPLLHAYLPTNQTEESALNFKPEPRAIAPDESFAGQPPATAMEISGELAGRQRLNSLALPVIPRNDVLAPSRVQVLVDTAGNIVNGVVLAPTDSAADQLALRLVHQLRFAPAPRLMFGEITFLWHTVPLPLTTTNAP